MTWGSGGLLETILVTFCFSIMHIVGIGQILPLFGPQNSFYLLSFYSVLGTRPGLPVLCRQGEGHRDNPVLGAGYSNFRPGALNP